MAAPSSSAAKAATSKALSASGKFFFGSLCVGTFGLGVWQTQRGLEKQALVQHRQEQLALDPVRLRNGGKLEDGSNVKNILSQQNQNKVSAPFRRVLLTGRFRHEDEMLVGPRAPPGRPGGAGSVAAPSQQGFYVVTPLVLTDTGSVGTKRGKDGDTKEEETVVLVNRGWIPRQRASARSSASSQGERRRRLQQRRSGRREANQDVTLAFDRPVDPVEVTVVPAAPERPRFLVAEHGLDEHPPRLFWYDLTAMQQLARVAETTPLVTALEQDNNKSNDSAGLVQPTVETVGAVKLPPAVHAGYAATWFGLSAAGLYMTRKLVTRGRK